MFGHCVTTGWSASTQILVRTKRQFAEGTRIQYKAVHEFMKIAPGGLPFTSGKIK